MLTTLILDSWHDRHLAGFIYSYFVLTHPRNIGDVRPSGLTKFRLLSLCCFHPGIATGLPCYILVIVDKINGDHPCHDSTLSQSFYNPIQYCDNNNNLILFIMPMMLTRQ